MPEGLQDKKDGGARAERDKASKSRDSSGAQSSCFGWFLAIFRGGRRSGVEEEEATAPAPEPQAQQRTSPAPKLDELPTMGQKAAGPEAITISI